MNTVFKYCFAATMIVSATACKKSLDLDIENPNRLEERVFWKTTADALQGINAVYGNFYRNGARGSRWQPFTWMFAPMTATPPADGTNLEA
jgi:hypothetical protein